MWVTKKDQEISGLENRVCELEELLCPFNSHDFVETDYDIGAYEMETYYYTCRRCRKKVQYPYKLVEVKK